MPWIDTADASVESSLTKNEVLQAYNGMDCMITHQVLHELLPLLDENTSKTYAHEMSILGPILDMMWTGIKIDLVERDRLIEVYTAEAERLQFILDRFATAVWGEGLNPNSPVQVKAIFYGRMGLPKEYAFVKGKRKVSTNQKCLARIAKKHFYTRPLVRTILTLREKRKLLGALKTKIDIDERFRTNYNIAGTKTGRLSSDTNDFGMGGNNQNITERLRGMFVADDGCRLAYCDGKQAESYAVGFLVWQITGDRTYLNACEQIDLHTEVARMVWPELAWTDDQKHNKEVIAAQDCYRHFSYRDIAKRLGHATNYLMGERKAVEISETNLKTVRAFKERYFTAFPGIAEWQQWVATELQSKGRLITPLGRVRQFMDRLYAPKTIRDAVAYVPQSTVGDGTCAAELRLWRWSNRNGRPIQLLMNEHDGTVFQFPEDRMDVLPIAMNLLSIPLRDDKLGLEVTIPTDIAVGWNWKEYDKDTNPDGIKKWKPGDTDDRTRTRPATVAVLDRLF